MNIWRSAVAMAMLAPDSLSRQLVEEPLRSALGRGELAVSPPLGISISVISHVFNVK
jgi:hypothetical protein